MLCLAAAGAFGVRSWAHSWALCFYIAVRVGEVGADRTQLILNSFDTAAGPVPNDYWFSQTYSNNGSISMEYIATPNMQGNGAMRVSYEAVQMETWGGFVEFGHVSNRSYSLVGATHVRLWYYIEQRSSAPERCHMRLILLDGSDCVSGCETEYGLGLENYFSFHHILDQGPGWHQLTVPLQGSSSPDAPFQHTGWVGILGNRVFDLNAIRGFIIEFSMDGNGQIGSTSSGVLLLDGLECVGDGLLSSAFHFDPTVAFRHHVWWSQDEAHDVSTSVSPTNPSLLSTWTFVNTSECAHLMAVLGNITSPDEAVGRVVQIGHILPGVAYYNLSGVQQISFQVRIALGLKAKLRFALLDASRCPRSCTEMPGHSLESLSSPQHILDDAGWSKIRMTFPDGFAPAAPVLQRTGSDAGDDHFLEKSAFKGFRFDISIDEVTLDSSKDATSLFLAGLHGKSFDTARLTLSSFDTSAGLLPPGYFYSRVYINGSISYELVDSEFVQGNGAMRIAYNIMQVETWGGFVSIGHVSNTSYSLAGASHISLWYNVLQRASAPGRAHMRLNLFDASHCEGNCDTEFGRDMENYYSFHQILDQEPGWHKITVRLEGSEDPEAPFLHTGWAGTAGNRKLDLHAIRGFKIEFSIDGSGALGSTTSGVLLLDGLECTGEHVLSSAFGVPSWSNALAERIWLQDDPGNASTILANLNFANESEDSGREFLHLNYTLEKSTSEGMVTIDHLLPAGAYYNLSGAEELSLQVRHLQAQEVPGSKMQLRLVLFHGGPCNTSCEEGSHLFFSPECELGESTCWVQVNVKLGGAEIHHLPSRFSGSQQLDIEVIRGFRLEFNVSGTQSAEASAVMGSVYIGDFSAAGVAMSNVEHKLSKVVFEDLVIFDLWRRSHIEKESEADYFSFVATKEDCSMLCLQSPSCVYFTHRLPSSQGNCALSRHVDGQRTFDGSGIWDDRSSSSSSYSSGWVMTRRPKACGDEGVCSCSTTAVTCASQNISIMPYLRLEERAQVKRISLEGSRVAVLTRALIGHLPVLTSLKLGNAVSFVTLDFLTEAPQLEELTTEIGLGTMIRADGTQAFSDICCGLDKRMEIGSASFFACNLEAKEVIAQGAGCDYEEFVFYSEEFVDAPILDTIKESNQFFGWAASSAPSCCALCKMIRGCTHFVQDERWSNSENICILRNSGSGRIVEKEDRNDYSCPDRDNKPLCLSLPLDEMGPGYISGYTPEQRVANGNISLFTSIHRAHLSKVNNYSFTYSVTVLGKIRQGALWITPVVPDDVQGMAFEPSRLVFYQGGLTLQTITLRCGKHPDLHEINFWLQHEAQGCDEAWGFLSKAQAHSIWVSAMPAECPPGELLNEDGSACEPCPAGTRQADGSEECDSCPAGSASKERSLSCTLCPPGRFSLGKGAFTVQTGSSECMSCSRGSYTGASGMSGCEPCSMGRFASEEGQTSCNFCPQNVSNVATMMLGAHTEVSCVCPEGFVFDGRICAPCPDMGIECPGGHSVLNLTLDETPVLKEGFMSLMDAPLSLYLCGTPRDVRCPGQRSPYRPEHICGTGFQLIAQCGLCKEGWYRAVSECKICDSSHVGAVMVLKMVATLILQFAFFCYMYMRWNRPNPSGLITAGSVFTFIQILHALLQMQMEWPAVFSTFLKIVDTILTPRGLLDLMELQESCVFGSAFLWRVVLDVIVPLTPCFHVMLLYTAGHWVSWSRANFDYVVNTVGLIFKGVFVAISSFTLQLFIIEKMPNGKSMVKDMPGLEFGTQDWLHLLPFGIFACLLYCVGFLSLVSYAVWVAPRRAAETPRFLVRFRFAFGSLRPGAFWWVIVQLAYNLGITLIKTIWSSSFLQIYLSTVSLLVVMAISIRVQPIKFEGNNRVEAVLNCSLLIFLILSTSFISTEDVSEQDMKINRDRNIVIISLAFFLSLFHALVLFMKWALEQLQPSAVVSGVHAKVALQFRDVVAVLGLMSNREFFCRVSELGEKDLQALHKQMHTLIPIFLHQQPGPGFFQHRIIPNAEYSIWDPHETTAKAIEAAISGEEQDVAVSNAKSRLALIKLAGELRAHTHKDQKSVTLDSWKPGSHYSTQSLAETLGLSPTTDFGFNEFCEAIGPLAPSLTQAELILAFNFVDSNGDGKASLDEFVTMLIAAAPHFANKYSQRFKSTEVNLKKARLPPELVTAAVERLRSKEEVSATASIYGQLHSVQHKMTVNTLYPSISAGASLTSADTVAADGERSEMPTQELKSKLQSMPADVQYSSPETEWEDLTCRNEYESTVVAI